MTVSFHSCTIISKPRCKKQQNYIWLNVLVYWALSCQSGGKHVRSNQAHWLLQLPLFETLHQLAWIWLLAGTTSIGSFVRATSSLDTMPTLLFRYAIASCRIVQLQQDRDFVLCLVNTTVPGLLPATRDNWCACWTPVQTIYYASSFHSIYLHMCLSNYFKDTEMCLIALATPVCCQVCLQVAMREYLGDHLGYTLYLAQEGRSCHALLLPKS